MKIECSATNGNRCRHERHRFRIGIDASNATYFDAIESDFHDRLVDAMIDHIQQKRPGDPSRELVNIQVWCAIPDHNKGGLWSNFTNPKTGAIMGVRTDVTGNHDVCQTLFLWACHAVQMSRDLRVLSSGLARAAAEEN